MAFQFPPFVIVLLASAGVAGVISRFAWNHRDQSGARPFAVLMAATAWWSLAYGIALVNTDLGVKVLASKAMYLGIVIVPVAWLTFALRYTGRGPTLTRRRIALLLVVPAVTVAMVWTTEGHGLLWQDIGLTTRESFWLLTTNYGPWFWVHTGYSYLLLTAGAVLILQMVLLADYIYRWQAVGLLIAVVAPWAGNALYLSGVVGLWDTTNVGFVVSGLVLAAAVFRQQLLDVVPLAREVARDEVIESMEDAVVVVDGRGRVVDMNPAAAAIVDRRVSASIGTPVGELLPGLADRFGGRTDPSSTRLELSLQLDGSSRHFDARITPLRRGYGTITGHLIIMRDVTVRERHRQRLEVMNRMLRHDLRNDMNILLGHVEDLIDAPEEAESRAGYIRDKALDIIELSQKARVLERTLEDGAGRRERIDIVDIVGRSVARAERDHPHADLRTNLPDEAPVLASELIDSAIENLLQNAIEHNDNDEPTVEVSVSRAAGDDVVEVRFADDGPGIPDVEREVLERGTESPLQHSSGLGLWLVHWIVTESNGDIQFDEVDPRGTAITVTLEAAEEPVAE